MTGLVFVVEVGGAEVGIEVGGAEIGVELGEGVNTTAAVTDDAAWVCEIVFAAELSRMTTVSQLGCQNQSPMGRPPVRHDRKGETPFG